MPDTTQTPPPSLQLSPPELAQLARGMAYVFWGQLALWAAGLEMIVNEADWLPVVLGLFGAAGTVSGSWALTQVPGIGPAWRRVANNLLALGVLLAYLSPFAWMWRQVPQSAYLLGHGLAWWWMLLAYLVVLNAGLRAVAKANRDVGLKWQATGVGAAAYLLLVGPFTVVVMALVGIGDRQGDALAAIRFLLAHQAPATMFALLLPLALTLSLAWSVKDWAFRRLTTPAAPPIVPPTET